MDRFDDPLTDLDGNLTKLRTLVQENKLNLILFYNNDCLGCIGRALPLAYRLQKEYDFVNLIVIHSAFGGRTYSAQDLEETFTEKKAVFPIYMEKAHNLYDAFECEGTPHWILMDGKGSVLNSIFGSQDGAQIRLDFAIQEFKDLENV